MTPSAATSRTSGAGGVLAVLAVAQFVMTVDTTVMNVSITAIVRDLHTTVTDVQLAITMFTLVMAAGMITGGRLGDLIGRTRAFQVGLVIYACGSGLTALSPNIGTLLAGWSLLEGLGAALVMPAIAALVASTVPPERRPAAYGLLAAASAAAVGLGPVIGGWVTTAFTWRYVFVAEVVVCAGVLLVSGRLLGGTPASDGPRERLDLIGVALSALGLGVVVFGIVRSTEWGVVTPKSPPTVGSVELAPFGLSPTVWLVFGGILLLWLFLGYEARRVAASQPALVDPAVFGNRQLTGGLVVLLAQNAVQSGVFFALPLFLSIVLGLDALHTGIALVPLSLSLIIGAMATPRIAAGRSPRAIVRGGLLVILTGVVILFASITSEATARTLAFPLFVAGLGVGMLASQLGNVIISSMSVEQSGTAGGLQYTSANLGASLGTAVVGVVLLLGLVGSARTGVAAFDDLDPAVRSELTIAIDTRAQFVSDEQLAAAIDRTPALAPQREELLQVNRAARLAALRTAMVAVSFGVLLALLATGRLPDRPLGRPAVDGRREEPRSEGRRSA